MGYSYILMKIRGKRAKKSAGVTSAWVKKTSLGMSCCCLLVLALSRVSSTPRVASGRARRQGVHYSLCAGARTLGLSRPRVAPARSGFVPQGGFRQTPPCIHCAAFSAIIRVGELVLPLVISGITPASTTRRPRMPRTRRCESTTAIGSSSRPILVVPTG